ncbi:MAG: methyltransferase family protein [Solirubrobacterales bacterium]
MAGWAVGLLVVYLAFAFGVRVGVALRTTGRTGIAGLGGAPPLELLGGGLFVAAMAMGSANPVLVLADVLEPIEDLEAGALRAIGFVCCGVGIVGTFLAQMAMGASWRIGVDESEHTELVTGGVFSLCRNPIYAFMVVAWIGFALLVPTWLSLASTPAAIVAFEVQVRLVEEPFLIDAHGDAYRAWASRVGRFVPGLGRLSPSE